MSSGRFQRAIRWRAKSTQSKRPAVSVLVKSFNHAAYIAQTIDSILNQTFQDFEIIITDDHSTDDTLHVLARFNDPRISIKVLPENRGISVAMNETIARARGRYLAILNSDDWAFPDRLRRQVELLDANPRISLLFGFPELVDETGAAITTESVFVSLFTPPLQFADYSRRSWLRQFFFNGNCLCAPSAMIRREVFETAGVYDPRLFNLQDLDMWIRALVAGYNIHWVPEKFTAYRIRADDRNASAPRLDRNLRTASETAKILPHFTRLTAKEFDTVFGEEAAVSTGARMPVALRVAELALQNPRSPYQSFALDTYYQMARKPAELRRLAYLAGSVDVWK
jgi:glycosyltransferase involved in cell wall biosynthesis